MDVRGQQTKSKKAIILDGSHANDSTGERVRMALTAELRAQGWDAEISVLREKKIGNCAGDFFCWIRNPGMCNTNDDNRAIARAIIDSDLLVYLTPVTFGGYSSALKRMVDHQIQNISPHFAKVNGETHHQRRYAKHPDLLVVGWMDEPDTQAEAVFHHLVQRNGINFYAKRTASHVVLASQSDAEIRASAQECVNNLEGGRSSRTVYLPASRQTGGQASVVRRAVLLVGSPRTRKSTSNSLGEYLFQQLGAQSIQTEVVYLYHVLRSPEKMHALLEAVDAADLVTLAFPLYVDSLPAPVIEALERIAVYRQGREPGHRQLFAAIANCGFPEAHHNAGALAICETFARSAGFEWAGSMALGGGEMIQGASLPEKGGQTIRIRKALELAATALSKGEAIPTASNDMMGKPVIPPWAYRLMGRIIWRQRSKPFGASRLLRRQPYAS